jgi:hypothetical protein
MRIPMPSPTGRNSAKLFLRGRTAQVLGVAYDAAGGLEKSGRERILEFVKSKLSEADFAELQKILAGEDMAADDPPLLDGISVMPADRIVAADASNRRIARRVMAETTEQRERDFARRFPDATKIKTIGPGGDLR